MHCNLSALAREESRTVDIYLLLNTEILKKVSLNTGVGLLGTPWLLLFLQGPWVILLLGQGWTFPTSGTPGVVPQAEARAWVSWEHLGHRPGLTPTLPLSKLCTRLVCTLTFLYCSLHPSKLKILLRQTPWTCGACRTTADRLPGEASTTGLDCIPNQELASFSCKKPVGT